MQFTEVSAEEIGQMEFAGRKERSGKNPYGDLLNAVKGGKTVKVPLPDGKQMKNLKWGITQAAKKADIEITIRVLFDQSGIVVAKAETTPSVQPEAETPGPEAPAAGTRSRK